MPTSNSILTSATVRRERLAVGSFVFALFAAYVAVGWRLSRAGVFGKAFDSLLFEADAARVIDNMTTFTGPQSRTLVHPIHVLLTAPLGLALRFIVNNREMAAVILTAAFAAGTLVCFDSIVRRLVAVPLQGRLLLLCLIGGSGCYSTFGGIPETHILSAFGLSLMTLQLTTAEARRQRAAPTFHFLPWMRDGGARGLTRSSVAVGALVTNIAVVPAFFWLVLPTRSSFAKRLGFATLLTAVLAVDVTALHFIQGIGAAPEAVPSVALQAVGSDGAGRISGGVAEKSSSKKQSLIVEKAGQNMRFVTPLHELPRKLVQVTAATLLFSYFPPRIEYQKSPDLQHIAARFDYLHLRLRWPGVLGSAFWVGLLLSSIYVAWRNGQLRLLASQPAFVFCLGAGAMAFVVFTLYSDELILFSPNWVFPNTLAFALVFGYARANATAHTRVLLSLLLVGAALFCCINSLQHLSSLLSTYGG